jgi:outer membrane protein assembly factor BamB
MKRYGHIMSRVAGAVAICSLLPGLLRAESDLLEQSGFSGGIVVVLDFSDGEFISDLAEEGQFVIHGLLETEADLEKTRGDIMQQGLYGKVSCDLYNGVDLPYVDNLINVLLCKSSCMASMPELMRVLIPGGHLLVEGPDGWEGTVKPTPNGMDQWNQFLHGADNNGVSLDDVGPPQRLRWHDAPEFGRSKSISPSFTSMISAGGVVFTIEDRTTTEDINAPVGYELVARDAFNGIELWKRPTMLWSNWQTESIKSIPTQQQRSLAAVGKRVYCCMEYGGPITAFNYRTGTRTRVYRNTEETAEFAIEGRVLYGIKGDPYKVGKENSPGGSVELYAIELPSGAEVWSQVISTEYFGGTLAVKGNRLVYQSQSGLTCLDAISGKKLWTEAVQEEQRSGVPSLFDGNTHPTIVLTDDAVFCGIGESIIAKSLSNGSTLWTAVGATNYMKSPDLFVADGLVWSGDLKGRDPKTGEVVRSLTQEMNGPMSHDRCYRNRITHRYYLNSASGGTDFLKLDGTEESPNPWFRSTCGLAIMPANGMLYNGPYVCQCAIGAMISGVNGLYNGTGDSNERFTVVIEPRLVKGSAFMATGAAASADDWPSYRGSSTRSGVTTSSAPATLVKKWKVDIGSHPTAPVVAGDSVYVADRDAYILYALDRETGETRWTFTAGGRIDSPPTYYNGLVLFGSRCGWVYCLRASDGQLAWKFNGMPQRRLVCDTGRLESAWPVNGSVMIFQDTVYFAAGRSSFLDGGIGVFGLAPISGKMKYGRMAQGPYQDDLRNFPIPADGSYSDEDGVRLGGTFQLEGFKSGIFSSVGNELFIRHQPFSPDLNPISAGNVKTLHLMASPGFLNDSPQHRTYWTVDQNLRYGGPTGVFGSGPAGDVTAYDGQRFYEVRGYAPGRNLVGRGRDLKSLEIYSVFSGRLTDVNKIGDRTNIPAVGEWDKRWDSSTPFAGHAIAVSQNTVLAAGVPMLEGFTVDDTNASFAGERGGIAWLMDAESGEKLQELRLDAAPTWDGIAIAHGCYFICLKDGSVACFSGQ